jgi:hypothetical protein
VAKVTLTDNPLNAKIEIDDRDIKTIKHYIIHEQLWEIIFSARYHLKELKNYNPVKALEELEEYSGIEKEAERLLPYFLEDLNHTHGGDCTAVAASCGRCLGEDYLGINTIPNMSKGVGSIILGLFKDGKTIDQVIEEYEELIKSPITHSWGKEYDAYIPEWEQTRIKTLKYLKEHKLKLEQQ